MSEANVEWACEIAAKYAKGTRDERIWWEDVAPMLREVLAASALRGAADGPSEPDVSMNDAPAHYNNGEAYAWATGYDAGWRAALSGGEPHEEKR